MLLFEVLNFDLLLVADGQVVELLLEIESPLDAAARLNKIVESGLDLLLPIAEHPLGHGVPAAQNVILRKQFGIDLVNFVHVHKVTPEIFRKFVGANLQVNGAGNVSAN